jgi:hypothetical protein
MWLQSGQLKKWRSDSLEARIYAIAEAEAHANGHNDGEAAAEAMEAVYRVMAWLASGRQADVIEMIKDAYGIETSAAALSAFWRRFRSSWLGERLRRSNSAAKDLAGLLDREKVESATWDLLTQQAFELLTSPDPEPAALVKLGKLLLQSQKQDLDERKVKLLEEKARKLDAVREAAESSDDLTPEERLQKIREGLKI